MIYDFSIRVMMLFSREECRVACNNPVQQYQDNWARSNLG